MTRQEALIYVQSIKQRFPHPISVDQSIQHMLEGKPTYCIGSAFCQFYSPEFQDSFVDPAELAALLQDANDLLDDLDAGMFAELITDQNDQKHFTRAWQTLTDALSYGSTL